MTKAKLKAVLFVFFGLIIIALLLFGWKIPPHIILNGIKLPDGYETIYKTKVIYSDIERDHVLGEKIIKCDKGLEYVKKYIEENNSVSELENISVTAYYVDLEDAVYFADFRDSEATDTMSKSELEEMWTQHDKYVRIRYIKDGFPYSSFFELILHQK